MANVNTTPKRFESGGTITITPTLPTGTAMTVLSKQPGTLNFTKPIREAHPYTDAGVQQQPLEGDNGRGKFKMVVKAVKREAAGLLTTLAANGPSSSSNAGCKATFLIEVTIPEAIGGAVSTRYTFTDFFLTNPPEFQAGTDFDTVTFEGEYLTYADAAS